MPALEPRHPLAVPAAATKGLAISPQPSTSSLTVGGAPSKAAGQPALLFFTQLLGKWPFSVPQSGELERALDVRYGTTHCRMGGLSDIRLKVNV